MSRDGHFNIPERALLCWNLPVVSEPSQNSRDFSHVLSSESSLMGSTRLHCLLKPVGVEGNDPARVTVLPHPLLLYKSAKYSQMCSGMKSLWRTSCTFLHSSWPLFCSSFLWFFASRTKEVNALCVRWWTPRQWRHFLQRCPEADGRS